MTIAELRALLAATTARVGALPWTASDPANISQVAVAEVFNALPKLLDVGEAAQHVRECRHNDQYGGPCSECLRALTGALDRMIPNGNTKVMKIFDHTRGA